MSFENHRPTGTWRFLTPLDTIQPGDLGRCMTGDDFHDTNWSVVSDDTSWIFNRYKSKENVVGIHPPKDWEFIRQVDGAVTVLIEEEVRNGN